MILVNHLCQSSERYIVIILWVIISWIIHYTLYVQHWFCAKNLCYFEQYEKHIIQTVENLKEEKEQQTHEYSTEKEVFSFRKIIAIEVQWFSEQYYGHK